MDSMQVLIGTTDKRRNNTKEKTMNVRNKHTGEVFEYLTDSIVSKINSSIVLSKSDGQVKVFAKTSLEDLLDEWEDIPLKDIAYDIDTGKMRVKVWIQRYGSVCSSELHWAALPYDDVRLGACGGVQRKRRQT